MRIKSSSELGIMHIVRIPHNVDSDKSLVTFSHIPSFHVRAVVHHGRSDRLHWSWMHNIILTHSLPFHFFIFHVGQFCCCCCCFVPSPAPCCVVVVILLLALTVCSAAQHCFPLLLFGILGRSRQPQLQCFTYLSLPFDFQFRVQCTVTRV